MQLAGQRVKVSREVSPGDILRIRQGWDEREVTVLATSEQRRGAPIAQTLYEETQDSLDRRSGPPRRARQQAPWRAHPKASKHERRALERLRKQFDAT